MVDFMAEGGLMKCTNDTSTKLKLFVIAACSQEYVSLVGIDGDNIVTTTYLKTDIQFLMASMDWLATLVFLLSIWFLRSSEENDMEEIDGDNTTLADYTVYVEGLPPHRPQDLPLLKNKLQICLEEAINDSPDSGNRRWKDIQAKRQTQQKIEIHEIVFGLNNRDAIQLMKKRGAEIRKYEKIKTRRIERQRRSSADSPAPKSDKTLKLAKEIRKMEKEIKKKNEGCTAVAAFVTFKQEEGYLRCLQQYPNSFLLRLCQSEKYKLKWTPPSSTSKSDDEKGASGESKEKHYRLSIRQAREPTEVIWENLQASKCNRCVKSSLTTLIALVLIVVTFAFTVVAKNEKAKADRLYPPVKCDSGNPPTKRDVILDENYNQVGSNLTRKEGLLTCYCENLLKNTNQFNSDVESVWNSEFPARDDEYSAGNKYWCLAWAVGQSKIQSFSVVAILGVIVVNMILTSVMRKLVVFESHHFKTDVIASLMTKLFLMKLLNTGIVVLIVNANLEDHGASVSSPELPLFAGSHGDFNMSWYYTVGTSILTTMIVNSVSFVVWPLLGAFNTWKALCRDRGCSTNKMRSKKKTQHEYNSQFIGPEFLLADRYAACLNNMFVCLMYSAGMPMLLWVGFVGSFLRFVLDRWAFVNLYRAPPEYDATVARSARKWFPYAALMHICFAMWMFTNPKIFGDRDSTLSSSTVGAASVTTEETDNLQQEGIGMRVGKLPHFAVLFTLITLWLVFEGIIWQFFKRLILTVLPCLERCNCAAIGEDNDDLEDEFKGDFSGLKTYAMEVNPEYENAFARDSVAGKEFASFGLSNTKLTDHGDA